jgi:membrane protein YdbS with pleckstrin-like domain
MKCAACDAEAAADASFCPKCGAKLSAAANGVTPAGASLAAPGAIAAGAAARTRVSDVPEEVLWTGSYSPKSMLGLLALLVMASLACVVAAILLRDQPGYWIIPLAILLLAWLYALVRLGRERLGVSYKLTNQMFYHQRGVLTRTTDRIELIEIHDVTYEQGLFDRLVDVGTIKIASNDRTDPILYVRGVENVSEVARMIDQARRGEQVRRGRRIESLGVHDA